MPTSLQLSKESLSLWQQEIDRAIENGIRDVTKAEDDRVLSELTKGKGQWKLVVPRGPGKSVTLHRKAGEWKYFPDELPQRTKLSIAIRRASF